MLTHLIVIPRERNIEDNFYPKQNWNVYDIIIILTKQSEIYSIIYYIYILFYTTIIIY